MLLSLKFPFHVWSRLENQLSDLTKLADNFGLLDDVKSKWETSLRREIRNQRNPRSQGTQGKSNETAFDHDMCVRSRQVGSFHPVPCRRARLCNDASSVGPLTMAGTIFLQIVALVVSFFMAVQYFLRYAPRRLFGLFPPWCLVAMKLDENRHAAMRRRLDY